MEQSLSSAFESREQLTDSLQVSTFLIHFPRALMIHPTVAQVMKVQAEMDKQRMWQMEQFMQRLITVQEACQVREQQPSSERSKARKQEAAPLRASDPSRAAADLYRAQPREYLESAVSTVPARRALKYSLSAGSTPGNVHD